MGFIRQGGGSRAGEPSCQRAVCAMRGANRASVATRVVYLDLSDNKMEQRALVQEGELCSACARVLTCLGALPAKSSVRSRVPGTNCTETEANCL